MGKFSLYRNDELLKEFELESGVTIIGRKPDNELVLEDRSVSGRHARVLLSYGQVTIQDLDSTNGTFVNGERVTTRQLDDGDVVTIGNYRLEFVDDQAVAQDERTPTRILRLDTPGMPPGAVDTHATDMIRKWRSSRVTTDDAHVFARRIIRLRILSGCNQGRHLDLLSPVTALGEPGHQVIVLIREGPALLIRVVEAGPRPVLVNGRPLDVEVAHPIRHHDVIEVGDVRMMVVFEASADELGAGTEGWTLE